MASNPNEPHVCGAAGYGAIGDICPACEADRAASPQPAEPPDLGILAQQCAAAVCKGLPGLDQRRVARVIQVLVRADLERKLAAAELRASTEAERARGLEAQLALARPYVANWMQANEDGWIEKKAATLKSIDAALSQLPTPNAEPQQT